MSLLNKILLLLFVFMGATLWFVSTRPSKIEFVSHTETIPNEISGELREFFQNPIEWQKCATLEDISTYFVKAPDKQTFGVGSILYAKREEEYFKVVIETVGVRSIDYKIQGQSLIKKGSFLFDETIIDTKVKWALTIDYGEDFLAGLKLFLDRESLQERINTAFESKCATKL